jgi:hypothetical protein
MRKLANVCGCIVFCLSLVAFSQEPEGISVPPGYKLQVLDATDGRIAMPSDWFYSNRGTPTGWSWTFSAEDPKPNGYETGLRLQLILNASQRTKQSKEAFANAFIEQKRKSLRVFKECSIADLGHFKRQCIEVLEEIHAISGSKLFRIQYSVMWFNDFDFVVVSTFGAPEEKWDSVVEVSKVMSEFVIFSKNPGNAN